MLKSNVTEPAQTKGASPVLLAPKKDGALRFCIDYRQMSALTVRDSYPIPRMDECIDYLGDAKLFTKLDCNSGYWQVEVDQQDRDKTAFTSHHGMYRFKRMLFGLTNFPGTLQRAIDVILTKAKWQCALVYLDEVIILTLHVESHFEHVATVLQMMRLVGVMLKLRKSFLFHETVEYLWHVIHPGKLDVAARTIDAIKLEKQPTTVTEMRSILGLCNVYRRFVPNLERIAAPRTQKLSKGERRDLNPLDNTEARAFDELKGRLIEPPILALPKVGRKYIVHTDACDGQVGCVLLQEQHERPP